MELEESRISGCEHRFRSKAAIRLTCCEAGGSDGVDAEAGIPSRVENVTQTTQRAPTVNHRPQEQQVVRHLLSCDLHSSWRIKRNGHRKLFRPK